jgi:hypothetical protein
MNVLVVPLIAIGVVASGPTDEPTEHAMRAAFEAHIASEVQAVIDFASETGGPEAVARIRAAGTDRFEIRTFQKLNCARSAAQAGYVCGFMVDIDVVNGALQSLLVGRFIPRSNGFDFSLGS